MPPRRARTQPTRPAPSLASPVAPVALVAPPAPTGGPHWSQYSPVDIHAPSADLHTWQAHWEVYLTKVYYVPPGRFRKHVDRIAVPDALDPDTAAERADRVLKIRARCDIIRDALNSYEGQPRGSFGQRYRPVDAWTGEHVGPKHREAIILAALAHASILGEDSGEGE